MTDLSTQAHQPSLHRIHCSEIWGGMRNTDSDVCTRGITASIFASASDAEQGGDIYYLAVCSSDMLTRIVIADVCGHGSSVAQMSEWVYDALSASMGTIDGAVVLVELNNLIHAQGFQAMTTAVVVGFYVTDFSLSICYAGHPPILLRQQHLSSAWDRLDPLPSALPTNLPLGVVPGTAYEQMVFEVATGDRIALYTDGVTECPSPDGTELGVEGLRVFLEEEGKQELFMTRRGVMDRLSQFSGGRLYEDDVTMLLMEIR